MTVIDPQIVAGYVREVAQERIIPRYKQLEAHEISTKSGPSDLVTIADQEAEDDLEKIFLDMLPGSIVVGEEGVSGGRTELSAFQSANDDIWVIDPVDGTHNFAHGRPVFGTMVALIRGGETVQAWIFDIPGNRMAIAEKSSGTEIDGQTMTIEASDTPLSELHGFISQKFMPASMRPYIKQELGKVGGAQPLFCCAHEYLDIVAGKAAFAIYARIKQWDHLPGSLMIEEAGGYVRKWDGAVYMPKDDFGGLLACTNEVLWAEMHDIFLKKLIEDLGFNH